MPAVKAARPLDIFGKEDWRSLTTVSPWRGLWLIAHAWLVIALAAGGAALAWQWYWLAGVILTPLAIIVIGGRQLGLAILMHEAAHGLMHPKRRINNFAGQWLSGAATGADLQSYRAYHLTHHKFTQQAEDPDLALSKPFPTSRASLRRKVMRDLIGQTFLKQRTAQFGFAYMGLKAMLRGNITAKTNKRDTSAGTPFNKSSSSGVDAPVRDMTGAMNNTRTVGRFLTVQAILLAICLLALGAAAGATAFAIWLASLATTFQLFLRIRNIAEHACTTTGSDDPFTHARTTYAGPLERATVAPYWVNYHSEHHLFMGVPCYNLPRAHAALMVSGFGERMTIAGNYREVMRRIILPPEAAQT